MTDGSDFRHGQDDNTRNGAPNGNADLSTRRLVSVAAMTVLGLAVFVVALVTAEPNWMMWIFGGLMVASALAFWTTYAVYRIRRARSGQ